VLEGLFSEGRLDLVISAPEMLKILAAVFLQEQF
jgi:hypothetical protein